MLTDRQEKVLKLIVEKYIKDPVPVGSKTISKILKCSSATVRNEMSALEEKNLLEKTHTSSGRVPSEDGYRYYVNHLMEPKKMTGEDMLKLQTVFHNQQLALSDVIVKSLQVISDMTNYTTVVLGSTSHENLLKQIEVVPIDDVSMIVPYLPYIDLILVMGVVPGRSGQKYISNTTEKLKELNVLKKEYKKLNFKISIDGGINDRVVKKIKNLVDIVVSGNYIIGSDNYQEKINSLR